VVAGLATDGWRGPSSTMMSTAASRYVDWLHGTAGQAEQTAAQARAAAAAYQTAWAATVPPPVIVANRLRLTTLIATNFFGQNSPAIAATEADYERMWAQDVVAMHSYAASASSASTLTPFTAPPTVTTPAPAAMTQSAAAVDPSTLLALALDVPSLTSAAASTSSSTFSGISIQTTNHALAINAMRDENQGIGPFIASAPRPGATPVAKQLVSAATGRASLAGALSVPQSWAAAEAAAPAPVGVTAGRALAAPTMSSALPPGVFGEAMLGTLAGRGANNAAAKMRRPSVIPRSPAAG
jgi:PPE-repeat protein